jgi:uncharacterized protein
VIKTIFNKEEGRIRSLARVLAQFALFFFLVPCSRSIVEGSVRLCFGEPAAKTILAFDCSQFIVVFIAIVGSIWICLRFLDKRRFSDLGVVREKGALSDYVYGLFLSIALVGTMLALELGLGAARISSANFGQLVDWRFLMGIMDGLLACIMIGFQEELLRFYQIKNLSEGMSGWKWLGKRGAIITATILASILFGLLHLPNNGATPQAVLLLALDGLFLSLIYITTGRAWLAFGFHAGWDFAEGNLFGYPVSGYPETYSLLKVEQTGASVLTGGTFGPDGGLINFVMIALGTLLIMAWIYFRYRQLKLKLDLCAWG